MANGVIFGRVLAIRDYSILLDDGNFYGARDMVDQLENKDIQLKDNVLLAYWTKAVKNEETERWINYRNIRQMDRVDDADFPRLAGYFDEIFDGIDLPRKDQELVDADDVPF